MAIKMRDEKWEMRNNEEKVYFETSDNLTLCGLLSFPQNVTQKCIVLCHGITVDKKEDGVFTELARKLCDAGFAALRFDFRGHGESGGKSTDMTIAGETRDLEAAIKFLQEKGFGQFGIVAASFAGGAVSLFAARHLKLVKALALWNAVVDYSENINPTLEWTRKYWGKPAFDRAKKFGFTEIGSRRFKIGKTLIEEIKKLKPWQKLMQIKVPTLFVHGDKDTYVPIEDSIKYSQMMKNAELKIIHGAEHGFHENSKYSEKADEATIEFFLKNMQ